jgi:hypothetical protein
MKEHSATALRLPRLIIGLMMAAAFFSAGCRSTRANADPSALLSGYQPEPKHNTDRAALERLGDNRFRVTVKGFDRKINLQRNREWCWAAAAERVLSFAGKTHPDGSPITQDDLVRALRPHSKSQVADGELLMLAMTPALCEPYFAAKSKSDEKRERRSNPPANIYWETFQPELPGISNAVQDLLNGGLVAVGIDASSGTTGHIYVAYAAEFGQAAVRAFDRAPYHVFLFRALDPYTGQEVELRADKELQLSKLGGGEQSARAYVALATSGFQKAKWTKLDDAPKRITISPMGLISQ